MSKKGGTTKDMAPRSYNAAVDMVDRNVAEGRAGKVAFIDPARKLTYGALADAAGKPDCYRQG